MDSSKSLISRFTKLSLVNGFSNLMVPLTSLVDAAFLGHLKNVDYLAGVALASIIFSFLYRCLRFLRSGTTGITAQLEARSEEDEVILVLLRNSLIGLILGLVLLILQSPLRDLSFSLFSASTGVEQAGISYYDARIWAAPAVLINFVLLGWFMGRERGTAVLVLSLVGNLGNMVLDYLLIVIYHYQSTGAGIATAASQYLMLLASLIFLAIDGKLIRILSIAGRVFRLNDFKNLLKLNGDIFIARIAFSVAFSFFESISGSLGTLVLAANTLILQVFMLAGDFVDGISFSTESLAGSLRGGRDLQGQRFLLKMTSLISLGIALVAGLAITVFPDLLFGVLTNHNEVIGQVHQYLLWLIPVLVGWCLAISLNGYLIGLTETDIVRDSMLLAMVFGFVPLATMAWKWHWDQLLWLSMFSFIMVRLLILAIRIPGSLEEMAIEPTNSQT